MMSKQLHKEIFGEIVEPQDFDWEGGISEEEYRGQDIWDGEKFVTSEEWEMQQREEEFQRKLRGGKK